MFELKDEKTSPEKGTANMPIAELKIVMPIEMKDNTEKVVMPGKL